MKRRDTLPTVAIEMMQLRNVTTLMWGELLMTDIYAEWARRAERKPAHPLQQMQYVIRALRYCDRFNRARVPAEDSAGRKRKVNCFRLLPEHDHSGGI